VGTSDVMFGSELSLSDLVQHPYSRKSSRASVVVWAGSA